MDGTYAGEREILLSLLGATIEAAQPQHYLPAFLDEIEPPKGRTVVVAAGKAAAAMAETVERHWAGRDLEGLAVARSTHGHRCSRIRLLGGSHPVPDSRSENAGRSLLDLVASLTADDLVLCLLSGGASSLIAVPPPGLDLNELRALNRALLNDSGMPIKPMNIVRKHVSAIAGGRLAAAAWPAKIITLAISDIPGDDLGAIGSGPTVGDPSTGEQAMALLDAYKVGFSDRLRAYLRDPANETVKPDDVRLRSTISRLVMTPDRALHAAIAKAGGLGFDVDYLGAEIEGDAAETAVAHAGLAIDAARRMRPGDPDRLILSGGELSVNLGGVEGGRGGRNQEYALALAIALRGIPSIFALAADTDGQDGSDPVAGAFVCPDTLDRPPGGIDEARRQLARHNSLDVFAQTGGQIVTGDTGTNVNDFRAILIRAAGAT